MNYSRSSLDMKSTSRGKNPSRLHITTSSDFPRVKNGKKSVPGIFITQDKDNQ